MRELGLLPAPSYIQNLDHSLLNYLDIQFRRIEENWRVLDSSAPSGAAIPAGNVIAGTFGSNVGNGNYTFPGTLVVSGATATNITSTGAGAGYAFRERDGSGDWVLYADASIARLWLGSDLFVFESGGRARFGLNANGEAIIGPWPTDGNLAYFGSKARTVANASHYAILSGSASNDTYISGSSIWFRAENNGGTQVRFDNNYVKEFFGNGGSWDIGSGVRVRIWNDGEVWAQSYGAGGDNGYNEGYTSSNGWMRFYQNDVGWHTEPRGAGMMGASTFGNQNCATNNNETTIIARKISQAGWATAGLSSFGENSGMVPYISLHASGCCTSNWRKDSGQSYMVCINSGGGCDVVWGSGHNTCSEKARKRNISVADEYGLKTIRGLIPHKFQYEPTDEDEIWQWEKWKYDRSIGIWTVPPSEHMGWDTWHIGFFAEEMANLVPEVVGFHPDGLPKGIDYGNLVVVAIAAINELADKVEDLEAKLYALT